jgi:hypothetical protein
MITVCNPCVPHLSPLPDRVAALRAALAAEPEPLIVLTHLLRLCRDEHPTLWAQLNDESGRVRARELSQRLRPLLAVTSDGELAPAARQAIADELAGDPGPAVTAAHALAGLIDDNCGHTFAESFRRRSPYRPGAGDPVPLGNPDLPATTSLPGSPDARLPRGPGAGRWPRRSCRSRGRSR